MSDEISVVVDDAYVAPSLSDLQSDAIAQLVSAMEDATPATSTIAYAVMSNKSQVRMLRDEAYVPGTPPQLAEFLLALAAACVCSHACDNVSQYVTGLRRRAARSAGFNPELVIKYHLIALRCLNRLLARGRILRTSGRTSWETTLRYNEAFIQELDMALAVVS